MGPLPVIGEEKQPRRIFVEASYGKQPGTRKLAGQQVDDRTGMRGFCRRQDTFRLIQHEIIKFLIRYRLSFDGHRITAGLYFQAAVPAGYAIDGYGTGPAQLPDFFSGSPSRMAQ